MTLHRKGTLWTSPLDLATTDDARRDATCAEVRSARRVGRRRSVGAWSKKERKGLLFIKAAVGRTQVARPSTNNSIVSTSFQLQLGNKSRRPSGHAVASAVPADEGRFLSMDLSLSRPIDLVRFWYRWARLRILHSPWFYHVLPKYVCRELLGGGLLCLM